MFATKLKVASALFLSSFIVWLALILIIAQPTETLGQSHFSNFSLLAMFLGSAIAASLSSMVVGVNLLELKISPMSLTKKLGRNRVKVGIKAPKEFPIKREKNESQFMI